MKVFHFENCFSIWKIFAEESSYVKIEKKSEFIFKMKKYFHCRILSELKIIIKNSAKVGITLSGLELQAS
ncbi:MAG TPA: hypothetical protein VNW49_02195 [Puia sp.]|jgi:hypothetical protein|nr:hypothetical protein [Puia sp.]